MKKARVAVLISGRGSNMAALLYASRLPDCPYEIVLVASDKADALGLALAQAEHVPVFPCPAGLKKAELFDALDKALENAKAEFVALAGFMRVLPPEFVDRWAGKIVNVHPSLLPRYKGLDTHARALEAKDLVVGCSVHVVTAALDDGPVLGQIEVAVLPGDTPETLAARVLIAEHQLYSRTLADFVIRDRTPEALLARVREITMALPGAEEGISHGMPCFRIGGGKMFCYFTQDHHGDGIVAVIVKTSGPDEQGQLIDHDPDTYYRPAYFGPSGWVGLRLDAGDTDWDQVAHQIEQSWRLVAPRKLLGVHEFLTETPEEKREAAAIRRRWITLGEVLAVLAVLISGATLWNSYQERKSAEADRAAAAAKAERTEAALVLRATVEREGRSLSLAPLDRDQAIQSQRIVFPSRLGVKPVETVGDARIEAGWIADAVKKQDEENASAGDPRIPVAIVTRFASDGAVRTDAALYQLAYEREEGFLGGSNVRLRGLSLTERIKPGAAQKAVDRR